MALKFVDQQEDGLPKVLALTRAWRKQTCYPIEFGQVTQAKRASYVKQTRILFCPFVPLKNHVKGHEWIQEKLSKTFNLEQISRENAGLKIRIPAKTILVMQGMSKGIADLLCKNTRAEKFTKGNWIEKALTGSNGVERFLTLVKRFKDWFCETICLECLNGSMKMEKLFQKKTLKNSTKCQLTSSEISGDQSKKTCTLIDNSWPYLDLVFTNRRSRWKWQAGYWSFCHILVRYPPISLALSSTIQRCSRLQDQRRSSRDARWEWRRRAEENRSVLLLLT